MNAQVGQKHCSSAFGFQTPLTTEAGARSNGSGNNTIHPNPPELTVSHRYPTFVHGPAASRCHFVAETVRLAPACPELPSGPGVVKAPPAVQEPLDVRDESVFL